MPAVSSTKHTGNSYIDGILYPYHWAVSTLYFSFPIAPFTSYETLGFEPLNSYQQDTVRWTLAKYALVLNLSFVQKTGIYGDLRYAESDRATTAYAYYPTTNILGGDTFFRHTGGIYDVPNPGTYAQFTFIHETGHALGLKHPHDIKDSFVQMPLDRDSIEYTVMSYRSYVGAPLTGYTVQQGSYPTTPMLYDIAALQSMYGANFILNSGNNVYSWTPSQSKIFMTLWDGGGIDTYDFSAYTNALDIDLNPGQWTITSQSQLAQLGNGHVAIGNIANALLYQGDTRSLIENVIGGSGDDQIDGNLTNNTLTGGQGNDVLNGLAGIDTAKFSGLLVDYTITENLDGSWSVLGADGLDTLWSIEKVQFSDGLRDITNIGVPEGPILNEIVGTSMSETLVGTSGADNINGIGGSDKLLGMLGEDILRGGAGYDQFYFNTVLNGEVDTVIDFSTIYDRIILENSIFVGLRTGYLGSSQFYIGAIAHDSTDRIIYDSMTGVISWDPDGNGVAAPIQFAEIQENLKLSYADFYVV